MGLAVMNRCLFKTSIWRREKNSIFFPDWDAGKGDALWAFKRVKIVFLSGQSGIAARGGGPRRTHNWRPAERERGRIKSQKGLKG